MKSGVCGLEGKKRRFIEKDWGRGYEREEIVSDF